MAKILVVDDDPDFVEITRIILESKNYEVVTASDGKQALDVMRKEKPDLVLLDIMMAQPLDGLNVSQEMMEDSELKKIPVVVVSSITDSIHAGKFPTDQYLPLDDWLTKPVTPDTLLNKVELYLSRYHH
ncbi:MAG: response regulator [bacterium]